MSNHGIHIKARFIVDVELSGPGNATDWFEKFKSRYSGNGHSFETIIETLLEEDKTNFKSHVEVTPGEVIEKRFPDNTVAAIWVNKKFQYLLDHLSNELFKVADQMTDEAGFQVFSAIGHDAARQARKWLIKTAVAEYGSRLRKRIPKEPRRPISREEFGFVYRKRNFTSECWDVLQSMKAAGTELSLANFERTIQLMADPKWDELSAEVPATDQFKKHGFSWPQLLRSFESGDLDPAITTIPEELEIIDRFINLKKLSF